MRQPPLPQHTGPEEADRPPSMSSHDAAPSGPPSRNPCCLCWCCCCSCSWYVDLGGTACPGKTSGHLGRGTWLMGSKTRVCRPGSTWFMKHRTGVCSPGSSSYRRTEACEAVMGLSFRAYSWSWSLDPPKASKKPLSPCHNITLPTDC